MKTILVRYTPQLQALCGIAEETVQTEAPNAAHLFAQLSEAHHFRTGCGVMRVLINDQSHPMSASFNDGDSITFLPAMGGG